VLEGCAAWRALWTMSVWRRARADLRVPMFTVVVLGMTSDFAPRTVEGAASLEDWLWVKVGGSRRGQEEVEGSCSWVAMVGQWLDCLIPSIQVVQGDEEEQWVSLQT